MARRPLVAANWKMNGTRALNGVWVNAFLPKVPQLMCDAVLFAPNIYMAELAASLHGSALELGAQDVSEFDSGAYTGEVSALMLRDIGVSWSVIGHSERRTLFGDTDQRVAAKCVAARRSDLRFVLCVGETLAEREAGRTLEVVTRQLGVVIDAVGAEYLSRGALAYEPVWAIGTGRAATAEQAQAVHAALREAIARVDVQSAQQTRILYGGSVKPSNALELFSMPDIDGGLIGGASLRAEDFYQICATAHN